MIEKAKSREIRAQIRQTLMSKWDPIGVSDEPCAADEYDMYIGDVYVLLESRVTASEMASYLQDIETRRMGLVDDSGKPLISVRQRAETVLALQRLSSLFLS
jgi:hypothetical protein